jgi:diguanylate cyclase (GGDEF)-like protein
MSTPRRLATAASAHAPPAQAGSALLDDCGVLAFWTDPALDRWIRALVRNTGAALAGFCLSDTSHRSVKTVSAVGGPLDQVTELATSDSLETHLGGLAAQLGATETKCLYLGVPVVVAGQEIGEVGIADRGRQAWTDAEFDAVADTAAAISTELSLHRSREQALRVHQLMKSHSHIHHMIARDAPLPDVLLELCQIIERYDPTLVPSVLLLESASNTLHSGIGPSLPPEYLAAVDGVVIGPNIGTCGPAAWFGRLTISPDLASDPRWAPIIELVRSAGLAHCWSMPIKAAGDEVLGTLAFYGRQPREPLPEHVELLEDCARVAAIAIERSQTLDRLSHDARHDGLTGLANRRAIFEELDAAIERVGPQTAAAVLFIDLDGLKEMNDTLGHDGADEMIHEVAQRLSHTIGAGDFVGRFGGDEFIVIAEGITETAEAGELAGRLLEAIAQPLPVLDGTVITASIGITLVRSNAVDAREAIRDSDAAMYAAKRSGRDRCVFSEAGHQAHAGRRLQIARELRGAEVRGEMRLVFQPVIALPTMEIVGVEALLRWTSPTFGEVSPVEFIPIAERSGTIVPIGAWVLRESCETMARLAKLGHDLELNVNVSAFQVSQPDFPLWVRQTLAHAEFPVSRLGLEITETALMRPDAITTRNLHELHALGVRIVLDDFGTGYSSLSWLKQHPFSSIKIDRSFISGLPDDKGDRAIVAGVVGMANALGCDVTAEGVETEQQLATLQTLICGRVQGFLLARPIPVDELTALLAAGLGAERPAGREPAAS